MSGAPALPKSLSASSGFSLVFCIRESKTGLWTWCHKDWAVEIITSLQLLAILLSVQTVLWGALHSARCPTHLYSRYRLLEPPRSAMQTGFYSQLALRLHWYCIWGSSVWLCLLSFKEVHVYLFICKWVLNSPNHLLSLRAFPNDLWEIEVRLILIFFQSWQIFLADRDLSYPSKILEAAWQWLSSRMPPYVFVFFFLISVQSRIVFMGILSLSL